MHGLYFLYITHQSEGLSVQYFDRRDDAEGALLEDLAGVIGWVVHESEVEAILSDAYSRRGLEITANAIGTDDLILYLREFDTNTLSVRLVEVNDGHNE